MMRKTIDNYCGSQCHTRQVLKMANADDDLSFEKDAVSVEVKPKELVQVT